jgi:hypothetical protein
MNGIAARNMVLEDTQHHRTVELLRLLANPNARNSCGHPTWC